MPLFYSTSAPTAGNKNSITRTASGTNNGYGLRDFLLNRNIQNPIRYPQLSTSVNGSPRGGEPFLDTMVGSGVIIQQDTLENLGVLRYDNAIIMNLYKNQDPNAPEYFDIENIPTAPIYPTPLNGTIQYPRVPDSTIEQYGLLAKMDFQQYRKTATLRNLYVDSTKQVDMSAYISLQPISASQQLPSYDEAYGQILGGGKVTTQVADVIGSILNGQGVGITQQGVVPNFDIRASLAGRVLGAVGILNDTKLGTIGAQQLALALANNAAFNTEQAILGKLNLQQNVLAIFGAGDFEFPRPNYKITVSDDLLGKAVGTAERILGFTLPKSRLDDSGSIFFTESGAISNIERANSMLTNTGKGQRKALAEQFKANLLGTANDGKTDNPEQSPFRSGYSPMYKAGGSRDFLVSGGKPNLYAFDDSPSGGNTAAKSGIVKNFLQPVTEENPINEMNWNREKLVSDAGFISQPESSNSAPFASNFAWTSNAGSTTNALESQLDLINQISPNTENPQIVGEKKSLLAKTQKLFNSKGMMTMVSAYGSAEGFVNKEQIQTAVSPNGFISKGSGVLSAGRFNADGSLGNSSSNDSAANTFCRTWIPQNRYDKVNKLIRSRGLNQKENDGSQILTGDTRRGWRLHNSEVMSVLDDNGFVKITPYKTDDLTRQATLPKKYMFSIENLAWVGSPAVNLLPVEQGPGDLLTGKFGRIMWFPPYDLTFSESSSVNLESNLFIGRGEPLYTYNNTERTGQLSFKIIIDHPSAMNAFKGTNGPSDEYIRSWFAGCVDDTYYTSLLTQEEKTQLKTRIRKEPVPSKVIKKAVEPSGIDVYFQNDITVINPLYENNDGAGLGSYVGEPQFRNQQQVTSNSPEPGDVWPDSTDYGLNIPGKCSLLGNRKQTVGSKDFDSWSDPAYIAELTRFLKDDCPSCRAYCLGFASQQGVNFSNQRLAAARAEAMKKWLKDNGILDDSRITAKVTSKEREGISEGRYAAGTPVDQEGPKRDRYGKIKFVNEADDIVIPQPDKEIIEEEQINLNKQVSKRFYTEQDFFEKLSRDDYFVFDKIREKIRYFHPAFHSTTPEGFNSRLTFLLQCTRQGPTPDFVEPQNLAFGPQPVCILRIGDFYNTKIMIDNLSFDFEPLVWDLNPEGVGVQPMIANVTMQFKYIGGSSMYGPVNKLQNALSFNYFANSQVYDPRADYIATAKQIASDNLIKNSKLKEDRTVFGTGKDFSANNKKVVEEKELNYGLVPGLNSVTDSMGAFENEVPVDDSETTQANQQNAENNAQNNNQDGATNNDNNLLVGLKLGAVDYQDSTMQDPNTFQFLFEKQLSSNFTSDGEMTVTLTSLGESYTTTTMYHQGLDPTTGQQGWNPTASNILPLTESGGGVWSKGYDANGDNTFDNANFRVRGLEMTPNFTGFTTGLSYNFTVSVKTSGATSTYTRTFATDATTPSSATTSATTTGTTVASTDETIYKNAAALGEYMLINLSYTSDGKLKGRFGITYNPDGISSSHTAKLNLVNSTTGLVPIATFTMKGDANDNPKGVGDFETTEGNMKILLSEAANEKNNNAVQFCITVPDLNVRFYDAFSFLDFDCPDEGYNYGALIEMDEYENLVKDPCANCYSKGTNGKTVIIKGKNCTSSSSTVTYPQTYTDYFTSTGCDEAHDFTGKNGVNSNMTLEQKINKIQKEFYDGGVNPKITSLTVSITLNNNKYRTEYTAVIDKSSDGKAWMGFATIGSCGIYTCPANNQSYNYIERADAQWNGTNDTCIVKNTSNCYNKSREQCLREQANALEFNTLLVYQNDTLKFKQYFTQFTKSTYLPKK